MIDRARLREAMDLHRAGRLDEARPLYEALYRDDPDDADILHMRGVLAGQDGLLNESARLIGQAILRRPASPDLHGNLAVTLERLGDLSQAALAFCTQGTLLLKERRPDDALAAYQAATRLDPANAAALEGQVSALNRTGRNEAARALAETALDDTQDLPPAARARLELGRGNALQAMGDAAGALSAYETALAHDPLSADAHVDRAIALLDLGRYEEAWDEYEWRWNQAAYIGLKTNRPFWNGEPPEDMPGKLFVMNEQGYGDSIQFCRYVHKLAERGYDVLLDTRPALHDLYAHSFRHPRIALVRTPEAVPAVYDVDFAAMVGLFSLPRLLGPVCEDGPYLAADPARIESWRPRIDGPGLKVGLAWQGNPTFQYDFRRSMPSAHLAPLLARPDVTFYALQKDPVADFPEGVIDLGRDFRDFADTAAAMTCLDLVISTDTAVAHLAAALALPTWVMVAKAADWRWGREGSECPWYETVRVFRQTGEGDWTSVIAEIGAALDVIR